MIDIKALTESDIGRGVVYHREHCNREVGKLSSWNDTFVFVRFKGPNGEACEPNDVSFDVVPLDDTVGDECECEFSPYGEGDEEESWHYKRRCPTCRTTWYGLHCPHDGVQNSCPNCGTIPRRQEQSKTGYAGFESPLDAVVSGQFELCVPNVEGQSFIRNGSFKMENGRWSKVVSIPVSTEDVEAIKRHECVKPGTKGSLHHFHTRMFCVKPEVLIAD